MHDRRSAWRRCAAAAGGAAAGLALAIAPASWIFDLARERYGQTLEENPELTESFVAPFVAISEAMATHLAGAIFSFPLLVAGPMAGLAVGLRLAGGGLIVRTLWVAVPGTVALLLVVRAVAGALGAGLPDVPVALVSVAVAALGARSLIEVLVPGRAEIEEDRKAAGAGRLLRALAGAVVLLVLTVIVVLLVSSAEARVG